MAVAAPAPPLDRLDAVPTACKLLGLTAMIRDRRQLPDDPAECVQAIFLPDMG